MPDTSITYEDLADPKWKGKICIRSGQHYYNLALFGAMVAKHGAEKAKVWLEGLKANLAKKPSGGDRDVAKDIAAGACDIGIGNTYYVGLMQANPEQKEWAERHQGDHADLQGGGGTHINVSGPRPRQERAQQGQCPQARGMARLGRGAAHLCRDELRVSREGRASP